METEISLLFSQRTTSCT